MEKRAKFGALSSSVDPEKLSTTVSGAIVALSGTIIFLVRFFDLPLTENDIMEFASSAGIAVGALVTIYGLIRKVVVKFAQN